MSRLSVAVFAHNEEKNIHTCLESIRLATERPDDISVKVLINGSTDRTEAIVTAYAREHPQFTPVIISRGDKANAWNTYVYGGISAEENHIFVDGDIWLPVGTLDLMDRVLQKPNTLGVAPLPIGVSESLRDFLRVQHLICGTLYGVKGAFLQRIIDRQLMLPVGLIGDDCLLATLLLTDLDEHIAKQDPSRVEILEFAGPVLPRLPLLSTFWLQYRRLKRYAIRHFQDEFLYYHLRRNGLTALPQHATDLYSYWSELGIRPYLRYRGHQTPFNLYGAYVVLSTVFGRWLRKKFSGRSSPEHTPALEPSGSASPGHELSGRSLSS